VRRLPRRPAFTNGEFHDVGVPFLVAPGRVDAGRHEGLKRLRADRFNLLGPYNDDATGTAAVKTRHVEPQHANFGQFKTPSLRNVALTAPYMHDGRFATLRDVVRHYSTLDMERIHTHGEQLLRPLRLSETEIDDLVAFLESLTDPRAPAALPPRAPPGPCGQR
jgi:cytochrome c peroxidase